MKGLVIDKNTKALVVRENNNLTIIKKVASKSLIISSKALLAAFILTFVNLFV